MWINEFNEVYVGLGGNIGDTRSVLRKTIQLISSHPRISTFEVSRFYQTSPVSHLKQPDYINAVCRFCTDMLPYDLLGFLQEVEQQLGKVSKPKFAPRIVDCDILFFGQYVIKTKELEIPHPRWQERLFVLRPLADLVKELWIPGRGEPINLMDELQRFKNTHNEKIFLVEEL
jgi:2-amino-4-hydroxy-6-hydroxymethyldihydropteridine diphosphokinase